MRIDGIDLRELTLRRAGRRRRRRLAGDLPVPRLGAREPALRAAGRDRRGDRGGGARRPDPRHDRGAARGLRHRRRRARLPLLRRREAADRDRPHDPAQPAGARARRGDQRARRADRARGRRGARAARRGPHDDRHRPPALDGPRRRPDRRARRRPVVERGTHEELLAAGGRYAALVARDDAPVASSARGSIRPLESRPMSTAALAVLRCDVRAPPVRLAASVGADARRAARALRRARRPAAGRRSCSTAATSQGHGHGRSRSRTARSRRATSPAPRGARSPRRRTARSPSPSSPTTRCHARARAGSVLTGTVADDTLDRRRPRHERRSGAERGRRQRGRPGRDPRQRRRRLGDRRQLDRRRRGRRRRRCSVRDVARQVGTFELAGRRRCGRRPARSPAPCRSPASTSPATTCSPRRSSAWPAELVYTRRRHETPSAFTVAGLQPPSADARAPSAIVPVQLRRHRPPRASTARSRRRPTTPRR